MSFISSLCQMLIFPGNGIMFSRLILDLLLLLPLLFLLHYLALLLFSLSRRVRVHDRIVGYHVKSSPYNQPHWLFGHQLQYRPDHEGLMNVCDRTIDFPGLFSSHVGPWHSFLHLSHPCTVAPLIASSAPKDKLVYGFLEPWIGNGLLRSNGSYWRRHRRLITPAFHFNILQSYIPTFNRCVDVIIEKIEERMASPMEVSGPVGLLALDAMLQCAMSTITGCQDARQSHPYVDAIHVLSDTIVQRSNSLHLFSDWLFNLLPIGRRFNAALKVAHSFTDKVIADRRKELASEPGSGGEGTNYRGEKLLNFLDILLAAEDDEGSGLTDREVREEVDTFLFEGHDTTSSGIAWMLYNLAKHPGHQRKCRDEINGVCGRNRDIEWGDLPKLEYLTMCIKESLRLYPPVPAIIRQLDAPLPLRSRYNVSGQDAPKGSYVCLNIWSLHRNRHVWNDPDTFDPLRFSKDNLQEMTHNCYLPFSAGSRNCIGQNFAMNGMKVVLARILLRFRLSLDPSVPEPRMAHQVVLRSANGIHIKFDRVQPL